MLAISISTGNWHEVRHYKASPPPPASTTGVTLILTCLWCAIVDSPSPGVCVFYCFCVQATVRAVLISLYALGAVVTGSVVKSDFYSLRAPYKRLFLFGTLLLTLGLVLHIYYPDEYYYYGCMAMFCGMQSALGCKVKSTILRTCYMTGTATDIGAAVGKLLRLGPTKAHVRSLQLLIPCICKCNHITLLFNEQPR